MVGRAIGDPWWWRDTHTLSDRALVLVANRLTPPGSENGLARWLETDFVCDRDGRRWPARRRDDMKRTVIAVMAVPAIMTTKPLGTSGYDRRG